MCLFTLEQIRFCQVCSTDFSPLSLDELKVSKDSNKLRFCSRYLLQAIRDV